MKLSKEIREGAFGFVDRDELLGALEAIINYAHRTA
jgi:hypothetical protein